jgi:hypothetical protein
MLGARCPLLAEVDHGSWYFTFDAPVLPSGVRRRVRGGGFATYEAAQRELDALRDPAVALGSVLTVWLPTMASMQVIWRLGCGLRVGSAMIVGYVSAVRVPFGPTCARVVEAVAAAVCVEGRRDLAAAPPRRAP